MEKPIFAVLFFLALAVSAFADTEASVFPYVAETADKKYVFAVVKPECERCFGSDRYRQSGMYLNDGSTEPLWTVDWQNYVFLPADGKHVVRQGSWARYSATYREEVFSFISEGKISKTYLTADLIDFPFLLPHSSSHYKVISSSFGKNPSGDGALMKLDNGKGYPVNNGIDFDNEKQTMQIGTFHGDEYVFDLETGSMISAYRPTRTAAISMLCALALGYFAYLFLAARANLTERALKIVNYCAGFFLISCLFLIPVVSVWLYKIPTTDHQPDYPEFLVLCLMQISMLPRFLLTSMNLIAPPENHMLDVGMATNFQWMILFWLPLSMAAGFLNQIFTRYWRSFARIR